jgi:transcription factor WhiB
MTVTTYNPKNRKPPLWIYGGEKPAPDDFMANPRRNCKERGHYFFSEDLQDIAEATRLCATCPLLRPCTRWTLENSEFLPEGIFAGMDATWRRRIFYGVETYWDWAKEYNHARAAAKAAARQREKKGIRKRDQRNAELPECSQCQSRKVIREGRDKISNRQQYQCKACGHCFLGEEL